MFPTSIMASMMGFQRKTLFEISESERRNPSVSMTN
jgi:hypothetical protein